MTAVLNHAERLANWALGHGDLLDIERPIGAVQQHHHWHWEPRFNTREETATTAIAGLFYVVRTAVSSIWSDLVRWSMGYRYQNLAEQDQKAAPQRLWNVLRLEKTLAQELREQGRTGCVVKLAMVASVCAIANGCFSGRSSDEIRGLGVIGLGGCLGIQAVRTLWNWGEQEKQAHQLLGAVRTTRKELDKEDDRQGMARAMRSAVADVAVRTVSVQTV